MAEEKQVRGRDIAAPLDTLEVSGKQYKLAFTNETFRLAEDVYEYRYGRAKNFAEIAMDLTRSKIGAIMAILYGAIVGKRPGIRGNGYTTGRWPAAWARKPSGKAARVPCC